MGTQDLLQWLSGRVAGLHIQMEQGQSLPYNRGSRAKLFLDEMRAEPGMSSGVNINDIAMIKVFKETFAVRGGPTVAIYSRRGSGYGDKNTENLE